MDVLDGPGLVFLVSEPPRLEWPLAKRLLAAGDCAVADYSYRQGDVQQSHGKKRQGSGPHPRDAPLRHGVRTWGMEM